MTRFWEQVRAFRTKAKTLTNSPLHGLRRQPFLECLEDRSLLSGKGLHLLDPQLLVPEGTPAAQIQQGAVADNQRGYPLPPSTGPTVQGTITVGTQPTSEGLPVAGSPAITQPVTVVVVAQGGGRGR